MFVSSAFILGAIIAKQYVAERPLPIWTPRLEDWYICVFMVCCCKLKFCIFARESMRGRTLYLEWITLTHTQEIPYNSRSLVLGFYIFSCILILFLTIFNVVLVGYDTKLILQKDPNITHYDQWWTPSFLPSLLQIRANAGDCEVAKLNQDTTLKTNSTLPLFPYVFKSSYVYEEAQSGGTRVEKFVDGPYQANPLSSCFVREMGLYVEPWYGHMKAIATVTCSPTEHLPRYLQFGTTFAASAEPYMRADSTLDYFILDVHPDKTASNFEQWLDVYSGTFQPDITSRLNVLGVIDALAGDLEQLCWLEFDRLNDTELSKVPQMGFLSWDLTADGRELSDSSRLKLMTGYTWYDEFVVHANRTIINFMVALHDAIHLDLGHITPDNIYLNKASFNSQIFLNPYFPSITEFYINQTGRSVGDGICTWTRGCTPGPNITWAEILRGGDLPYNDLVLPIVQPSPVPISVIDMSYLCPVYVRKSSGDLLVSVFSATFSMYGTLYTLFSLIAPKLDNTLNRRKLSRSVRRQGSDDTLVDEDAGDKRAGFV